MAEDGGRGAADGFGVDGVGGADDGVEGGDGADAGFVDEEVGAELVDGGQSAQEIAEAREVGPFGEFVGRGEELLGDVFDVEVVVEKKMDEGGQRRRGARGEA